MQPLTAMGTNTWAWVVDEGAFLCDGLHDAVVREDRMKVVK